MKKTIALILALILATASLPALAYDYYSEWGSMKDWTYEQWDYAYENWTDEDWSEYYDAEEKNSLINAQNMLGMTNIGGMNININNKFIDFGDMKPVYVDWCTMVPLTLLSEELGLETEYNQNIINVKSPYAEVVMALGDKDIGQIKDGYTGMIKADAAPYLNPENNEVYVPVRHFTKAIGYDFFYYEQVKAIYIIDRVGIISEIDKNFQILNKLLKTEVDTDSTYEALSRAKLVGTLYGDKTDDAVEVNLEIDALLRNMNASINGRLSVDVKDVSDTLLAGVYEENKDMFKMLENTSFDVILNSGKGKIYVKSPLMNQLGMNIPDGAWYAASFPAEQVMQYYNTEYTITVGRLIYDAACQNAYISYYGDYSRTVYDSIDAAPAAALNVFLGDSAFVKSTSGGVSTYTLNMDNAKLAARFLLYGKNLLNSMDIPLEKIPEFNYTVQLKEKDNKITYMLFEGQCKNISSNMYSYYMPYYMPVVPFDCSFKIEGTNEKASGMFEIKGRYVGKLNFEMTTTSKISEKTVPEAPPEGDKIIDEGDLYPEPVPVPYYPEEKDGAYEEAPVKE